jgi:sulfate transport system ATP-binding protein
VFVTHDQEEALELADRVAILNAGMLEQVGTPDEVYDHPASAFVMSFVGDTSSIPVEVADGRLLFAGQPFRADVSGTCGGGGRLYVRPKDVVVGAPEAGLLLGTVVSAHRTAAGRRAQISLVGGAETIVEAEVGLSQKLVSGERVGLRFVRGRAFPADAGS